MILGLARIPLTMPLLAKCLKVPRVQAFQLEGWNMLQLRKTSWRRFLLELAGFMAFQLKGDKATFPRSACASSQLWWGNVRNGCLWHVRATQNNLFYYIVLTGISLQARGFGLIQYFTHFRKFIVLAHVCNVSLRGPMWQTQHREWISNRPCPVVPNILAPNAISHSGHGAFPLRNCASLAACLRGGNVFSK